MCRTAPYHLICNSMIECLNSTVIQMLCTLPENLKYKSKDSRNKLMYACNCTKHRVTRYRSYFLLFGKKSNCQLILYLANIKNQLVNNFQHLLRKRAIENNRNHNNKSKSNISIRKHQLTLGPAVMTAMLISQN